MAYHASNCSKEQLSGPAAEDVAAVNTVLDCHKLCRKVEN